MYIVHRTSVREIYEFFLQQHHTVNFPEKTFFWTETYVFRHFFIAKKSLEKIHFFFAIRIFIIKVFLDRNYNFFHISGHSVSVVAPFFHNGGRGSGAAASSRN